MDSQKPDASMGQAADDIEGDEELEVTRDELVAALQGVVSDLSKGLKGADRDTYLTADDLAQNDWFFAGISDEEGQYAVTMWPAEGEEEMLRIDIGGEDDVHKLASDSEQVAALTDDFIEGMSEEDDFDEYDEEDEDEEDLDEDEEYDEEDDLEEEDTEIGRDGTMPPR